MGSCSAASSNVHISDILKVDPEDWTHIYIIEWLKSTCDGELSSLIKPFQSHKISGVTFVKLTNEQLKEELQIKQFGLREQFIHHRDKLIHNYQKLHTSNITKPTTKSEEPIHTKQTKIITKQHCINNTQNNLNKSTDTNHNDIMRHNVHYTPQSQVMKKSKPMHSNKVELTLNIQHKIIKPITPINNSNVLLRHQHKSNTSMNWYLPKPMAPTFSNHSHQRNKLAFINGNFEQFKTKSETETEHNSKIERIFTSSKLGKLVNDTKIEHSYKRYLNGILYCEEEFDPYEWDTVRAVAKTKEIKYIQYEIPDDYHTLQQYKHHSYLYCNKIIINGFANQIKKEITQNTGNKVIIPAVIINICCKYYFEYEWHILQFAYDISLLLTYIAIDHKKQSGSYGLSPFRFGSMGGLLGSYIYDGNAFTGSSLVDIIRHNRFKQKYRLDKLISIDIIHININDYCKELINYGFITVVGERANDYMYINGHTDDKIKDKLFCFDIIKKREFDNYKQFMIGEMDRDAWTVGTIIQIYSSTLCGWQKGKIIAIDPLNEMNENDILIEYKMKTMNKRVDRYDNKIVKSTRTFILNRNNWMIGTQIEVFDEGYKMWFPAIIQKIYGRAGNVNENDISITVSYQTMFEEISKTDHITFMKWSARVRDVISDNNILVNDMNLKINPKHLLWYGFIRQYSNKIIPTDIINLIRTFCEIVIVWDIKKENAWKMLKECSYKDVIIGPKFEVYESPGVEFQLTLCPKDGLDVMTVSYNNYIVCYLELKDMAKNIKTMSFLVQFYCIELQIDCRGTVFYDSNDTNIRSESWSWGKDVIPFEYLNEHKIKSLHIECIMDVIHIEYHSNYNIKNKIGWLLPSYLMQSSTQFVWEINNKLLNIFKYSKIKKKYFNETLWNNCWMISCEPNGENNNVCLILHLIRLPFKEYSRIVSYNWKIETNNTTFTHVAKTHKFQLNMDDEWSDYSQQKIVMCSKQLLKKLSTLTIKLNIWSSLSL